MIIFLYILFYLFIKYSIILIIIWLYFNLCEFKLYILCFKINNYYYSQNNTHILNINNMDRNTSYINLLDSNFSIIKIYSIFILIFLNVFNFYLIFN